MPVDASLVAAPSSWGGSISPDGARVAFLSDRGGHPQAWVQPLGDPRGARLVELGPDPVAGVRWSSDGQWLACAVAPCGGVMTHVWAVRPDGSGARRLAGEAGEHVAMGPWTHHGAHLAVAEQAESPGAGDAWELVDPATATRRPLISGQRVVVLDLSSTERFALLRRGPRGARSALVLDRALDRTQPLLPFSRSGSTETGMLRPPPERRSAAQDDAAVAYLLSDSGWPRACLLAVGVRADGSRGPVGMLAGREDADLELVAIDDAGRTAVLAWNRDGRSEVELLDLRTGGRSAVDGLPGEVVSSVSIAKHGRLALLTIEGPARPREIHALDIAARAWSPVTRTPAPAAPPGPVGAQRAQGLVEPILQRFESYDGLMLNGWLYPAADSGGRALIWLHGGPEAQERPTFSPLFQTIVRAGITVFAPNVRGSSGSGRGYEHADDLAGRYSAIADVAMCARRLIEIGAARRELIACGGRSYGGYLTLAALVRFPWIFAAGIDVCGMSDLLTFYRDTEPWIAAAAVSKYGDPRRDAALLADLSPLAKVRAIEAPVLVVHGELDTNVPYTEATQLAAAMRALGKPVQLLSFPDEGHEYRREHSRVLQAQAIVGFLRSSLGSPSDRSD